MSIKSKKEFKEALEKIWLTPIGEEITQDLQDGVLIEEYLDDQNPVVVKKREGKWLIEEGPAQEMIHLRLFYYGDAPQRLMEAKSVVEFSSTYVTLFEEKKIVFIPMTSPEFLVLAGFGDFSKRIGLPLK